MRTNDLRRATGVLLLLVTVAGCAEDIGIARRTSDAMAEADAPSIDSISTDAAAQNDATSDRSIENDTVELDATVIDVREVDTGAVDAGVFDASALDSGVVDTGVVDTGVVDSGTFDTGVIDTGVIDTGVVCPSATQRCDATLHVSCAQVLCPDGAYSCTNQGGTWAWRRSTACDDGNLCTHNDSCTAGRCAGTTLACDAMDTACMDYSCDGDSTCSASPRTGAVCDDGNPSTTSDQCNASGVCVGTSMACALPATACADGAESRNGCAQARVIGRRTAASISGALIRADTCTAGTAFNSATCTNDGGPDHSYRIWMRAGETVAVTLLRTSDCSGGSPTWDAALQLFESTGCSDTTCMTGLWCRQTFDHRTHTHVATHDGWVVIVVDGATNASDEGAYRLQVQLTGCAATSCGC